MIMFTFRKSAQQLKISHCFFLGIFVSLKIRSVQSCSAEWPPHPQFPIFDEPPVCRMGPWQIKHAPSHGVTLPLARKSHQVNSLQEFKYFLSPILLCQICFTLPENKWNFPQSPFRAKMHRPSVKEKQQLRLQMDESVFFIKQVKA